MCILLKLDYTKFGVSNLFFSKVIDEKPLGGRPDPLGKGGLMARIVECFYSEDKLNARRA